MAIKVSKDKIKKNGYITYDDIIRKKSKDFYDIVDTAHIIAQMLRVPIPLLVKKDKYTIKAKKW